MHISFLIHNAYGIGGTIRTTFNLARTLAEQHEVEIVSVLRHRDAPVFDLGPRVALRHLVDLRENSPAYEGADPAHARPARIFPAAENRFGQYSELTDGRIAQHLRRMETDVVVGTRPGLNVHIAKQARRGPVRIGQEHLTLDTHSKALKLALRSAYPRLDAVTTVTEADARAYRRTLRLPGVRVESVPNSVPAPALAPADGSGKWVVAAGRLTRVKRYDVLIRAFAHVVAERPDWRLRIYGGGAEKAALRALIDELGLYNHVFLMGPANPLEPEWAKGSIAAVSSSLESFGMTIVEAMRCGLPVVATNCPHGPGEIIDDGVDGKLVPVGNPEALSASLLTLINDDDARKRMGAAALASSARFDPATVAERHEELFAELLARRRGHRLRGSLHRARGALLGGAYATKDAARAAMRGVRTV
ncbi:Glycosyltransferase involved in cell wall bisynthesis [Streptomyces sp. 2224.1]|uniref:glycosyltransferase family 4 protein n=1 Tax=unclassified Streptomyces TaxID=2593676 RepID=UPI000886B4EA|nr:MULTISPECIES: glycosyltransferase family 4 protein [unclassified Streptomyces]PBC81595.1 glycosyltransferase involved in cell wall bisynthesis [Streptomyces sp. 2321.6]SDR54082.1 Glycosyltransferase involved in cell wall bisynthesis [Streptomyces sp. KS_16]SEC22020.1 Glycosyltransferase involved in cell wall bisynthesis [Streptomyces sp. 2133.1]SED10930.1 Glycosyltransferase involved in cell wall bisynthesis [Streptomyces sp. 2224.1]SEF06605.1 Glycosyltransferase involved in cell wall bisyn